MIMTSNVRPFFIFFCKDSKTYFITLMVFFLEASLICIFVPICKRKGFADNFCKGVHLILQASICMLNTFQPTMQILACKLIEDMSCQGGISFTKNIFSLIQFKKIKRIGVLSHPPILPWKRKFTYFE